MYGNIIHMKKYRVAVVRGGPSAEYDVSMKTGRGVLDALSGSEFEAIDVIISKDGEWIIDGFAKSPEKALGAVDAVFIALHGAYGEDGEIQRELDRLSVPYTGSKAFPSSVAMNKVLTKELIKELGIKTPRHMRVNKEVKDLSRLVQSIEQLYSNEFVVKPITGGSSIDTYVIKGSNDLLYTLQKIMHNEEADVMVEERIKGREATAGVVNNLRDTIVYRLPVVEIIPPQNSGFFDYANKYNGETQEICPGRFSKEEKEELESLAERVHTHLNLSQYSRSDFIVSKEGIYFLEVNTLPGLTPESLLPKSIEAVGLTYEKFITHLLHDAMRTW